MTKRTGTILRGGASTDTGRRQVNQDRVLIADDQRLFAVADGMGGHRGGATAAELTVTELASHHPTSTESLRDAIQSANKIVFDRSQNDPDLQGMGTTVTALALVEVNGEERLAIANVGDSRTYLLRNGELEQLTEDHTLVAELVRDGHLTADEARTHKNRSVVTRAIGVEEEVEIDLMEVLPSVGDRYLLCSDGLSGDVGISMMAATLRRFADPTEASRDLIRLALANGSKDNISVVVVEVESDGNSALAASQLLDTRPSGSTKVAPEEEDPTLVQAPQPLTRRSARKQSPTPITPTSTPRKRIITGRSVLFFALLGVIGGVAWWALTNSPADVITDPTTSFVPVTTPAPSVATTSTGELSTGQPLSTANTTAPPTTTATTIPTTPGTTTAIVQTLPVPTTVVTLSGVDDDIVVPGTNQAT